MAPALQVLPETTATLLPGAPPRGLCMLRTTGFRVCPPPLATEHFPGHVMPHPPRPLPPFRHRGSRCRKGRARAFRGGPGAPGAGLVATGLGVPLGTFPLSWAPALALVSEPDPEAARDPAPASRPERQWAEWGGAWGARSPLGRAGSCHSPPSLDPAPRPGTEGPPRCPLPGRGAHMASQASSRPGAQGHRAPPGAWDPASCCSRSSVLAARPAQGAALCPVWCGSGRCTATLNP